MSRRKYDRTSRAAAAAAASRAAAPRAATLHPESLEPRRLLSAVTGAVFDDVDSDGKRAGTAEPAVGGVTVFLDGNNNNALDAGEVSTVTGADGRYTLVPTVAGSYYARPVVPAGLVRSDTLRPNNPEPSYLLSPTGSTTFTLPIGLADGGAVYVTARVDSDVNDTLTSNDAVAAGRVVYLDADGDGQLTPGEPAATINANGYAFITRVPAGDYVLRQVLPDAGWVSVGPDALPVTVVAGRQATGGTLLSARPEWYPTFQASVFQDVDGNGKRDPATEPLLAGRTVWLDLNQNRKPDFGEPTGVTADAGDGNPSYTFTRLTPGTYTAWQVLGADDRQTAPGDNNGVTRTLLAVQVSGGPTAATALFGVGPKPPPPPPPGGISGTVWADYDRDGVHDPDEPAAAGMTVFLDLDADNARDAAEPYRTTGSTGAYAFANVAAGTARVVVLPPAGTHWTDTDPSTEQVAFPRTVGVPAGQTVAGVDFNLTPIGRVSGFVFDDADADGLFESGENYLLPGRTVYIDADDDGTLDPDERRFTTAADGFRFGDLLPGTYVLRQVQADGWRQTSPAGGGGTAVTVGPGQWSYSTFLGTVRDVPTSYISPAGLEVEEGKSLTLRGSASPAAGHVVAAYEWDFDYDGAAFDVDATGYAPTFSAADADGYSLRTVALRARDERGVAGPAVTATVKITNGYPVVLGLSGVPATVTVGQPVTVSVLATDPSSVDVAAGLHYWVNGNDEDLSYLQPGDLYADPRSTTTFVYAAAGTYTISAMAVDKDHASSNEVRATIVVTPLPPPPPPGPVTTVREARAAADTYAQDGTSAAKNFGASAEVQAKKSSVAGSSREAFLRFPLTGGPAGATVDAAVVRVFAKVSQAGTIQLDLYAVASTSWGETTLTWNARPAVGAKLASKSLSSTAGAWVEFDVSAYVKAQRAAGATAVSFAVKSPAAVTPYAAFPSDEAAANRPALRLTETVKPVLPAVVLSTTKLTVAENKTASLTVKLDRQPAAAVTVTVSRTAGDPSLTASPATLVFTPANWAVAQTVTLAAANDLDIDNGSATFFVGGPGLTGATLTATEADDDVPPATSIAVRASNDAYVRDGTYASTKYGSAADLQVRNSPTAGQSRWTVLRFSLAPLTTIKSASLRLYGKLADASAASTVVQAFTTTNTAWTESDVTWTNKPAVSGGSLGQVTVTGTTAKWYAIDLTAWLKAQKAAGKTSVSLVLTSPTASAAAAVFDSDEAAGNWPMLYVDL